MYEVYYAYGMNKGTTITYKGFVRENEVLMCRGIGLKGV